MDVNEPVQPLKKLSVEETSRKPLVPALRNNGGMRWSQPREVSSRYMSPKRFPSPSNSRTVKATSQLVPTRATTAERKHPSTPSSPKRPSTPSTTSSPRRPSTASSPRRPSTASSPRRPSTASSPKRPSTPVQDTSVEIDRGSRKESGNRMSEVLWPSTMRSLGVSFQSDNISATSTRKEKTVTPSLSNHALRPSSNGKGTLLNGKSSSDRSENSRPGNGLDACLVGQHGWPSSISGNKSSSSLAKTTNIRNKVTKPTVPVNLRTRLSLGPKDDINRDLQRSTSDTASLVSFENLESLELDAHSINDNPLQGSKLHMSSQSLKQLRPGTPTSSKKKSIPEQSFSRGLSPFRQRISNATPSRGVSPTPILSRGVSSIPVSSRGVSPSRIRPSSPSRQESTSSTTSVLSFTPYIRNGKKIANHLEDVHQLRLLYNRHLQWRFANAQSDANLHRQKTKVEKTLYNMSNAMKELWDSVIRKRTELQQLRMKLELYSILKEQIVFLEEWSSIERTHMSSLSWAIEDLESSILRVPFTAGARGETKTVNAAIYSALNVIQSMSSAIFLLLSEGDKVSSLVTELANVATQERLMLDECGALLTSIAATQVEEYSLRTHLIQLKESLQDGGW